MRFPKITIMANYYMNRIKNDKRRAKRKRLAGMIIFVLLIVASIFAYLGYRMLYMPNVWIEDKKEVSLNIKKTDTWETIKAVLYKNGTIIDRQAFENLARLMKYPQSIKQGHYILKSGMSNRSLLTKLRSGSQDPVQLIFNNIRTKPELAGRLAEQLEADSISILKLLNDENYISKMGFNSTSIITMFIPNTYQVYWNIKPEKLFERMKQEYDKFWNASREAKLADIGFTRLEAMTLASIVEKETNKNDEKATIAGVYINRLKKGWLLQADPTLVFATGDFTIKRVLNIYKKIDSPYNTYMYMGLPPGPICIPSISSIDAVLNYQRHDYMFFCAREDFSGYHNFAVTGAQHELNAARYQQALDTQGIKN